MKNLLVGMFRGELKEFSSEIEEVGQGKTPKSYRGSASHLFWTVLGTIALMTVASVL